MDRPPALYSLGDIIIDSNRFDEPYNVAPVMIELNLFENLDMPYISGSILLSDSSALSTIINFNGQETITLEVSVEDAEPVKKTFIIYGVGAQIKSSNDQGSTLLLEFIEPHGYLSNFRRLNNSHNGKFNTIISNVLTSSLDLTIVPDQFEECFQSARLIAPNMTPLAFTDMMRRRATSDYGEPFYLFSTLKTGMNFRSLGGLLTDTSDIKTYRYTRVQTSAGDSYEVQAGVMLSAKFGKSDNVIAMAKQNAFGAEYISFDTFRRSPVGNGRSSFNVVDTFESRKSAGRLTDNRNNIQFDKQFTIGNDESNLNTSDRIIVSGINTSDMYGRGSESFDEETINENHIKRIERQSTLAMLEKQSIDIVIPGYNMLFSDTNTSVGTLIDIVIPRDTPQINAEDESLLTDTKRSGIYLVYACRHKFAANGQYHAALKIKRTDSRDNLEDDSSRNVR